MPEAPGGKVRTSIGDIPFDRDGGRCDTAGPSRGAEAEKADAGTVDFAAGNFEVFVDGCSRGNPGKSAAGYIIRLGDLVIEEGSRYLGLMTNNQAEYRALLIALDRCHRLGIRSLLVRSDSQLMVNQINGSYRVRDDGLRPLFDRTVDLVKKFENFRIEFVSRSQNREADKLAGMGLKQKGKR